LHQSLLLSRISLLLAGSPGQFQVFLRLLVLIPLLL
jgi:hypothetical protein